MIKTLYVGGSCFVAFAFVVLIEGLTGFVGIVVDPIAGTKHVNTWQSAGGRPPSASPAAPP